MGHRRIWAVAAALFIGGVVSLVLDWDANNPWFFVGLTKILLSGVVANAGLLSFRSHSMDEEFAAGHRIGFRAGRRTPSIGVVSDLTDHAGRKRLKAAANEALERRSGTGSRDV